MKKRSPSQQPIRFTSVLERSTNKLWNGHFRVPARIVTKLTTRDSRRVLCTLNDSPEYQCAIRPYGRGLFVIPVNTKLRATLGLTFGTDVTIRLRPDRSEYGLPFPVELEELLRQDGEGNALFQALTRGRQRTLLYIVAMPKSPEKRLQRAVAVVRHLKLNGGRINYRQLNAMLKDPRRQISVDRRKAADAEYPWVPLPPAEAPKSACSWILARKFLFLKGTFDDLLHHNRQDLALTRVLLLIPCIFLCCPSPALEDEFPESRHFRLERLADGVFAAINIDEGGYAICNAGIIDLGDRTIVFDPFLTPAAADDLRLAAETLTKRPVSLVVNSHFHNDHIRGNQIFVPGAEIISSVWTREAISRTEPEEIAWERAHAPGRLAALGAEWDTASAEVRAELAMWKGYYKGMIESHPVLKTVLPTLTFDTTLTIHGSRRSVDLKVTGRGHTMSDLVLSLPAERIVFMGDLLFVGRHPWLADGFPEDWVKVLRAVHGWGVTMVVPGHGPVSGPGALLTMAEYLEAMQALVRAGIAAGQSEEAVAGLAPPGESRHWMYRRFHPGNLRFLYKRGVEAAKARGH